MIKKADFSAVMNKLMASCDQKPSRIAVAVSGGADSLCLCLLADTWVKEHKIKLFALTVDHGLRKESASEAVFVHELLSSKQIEHTTLEWKGKKPTTHIEERAREERYRLLISWCKKNNVSVLLTAHHQDDLAETFLQHLIRSSGIDGLVGIQPRIVRDGIELWRPFLDFSRKEIQETMREHFHQNWIEDPSNQSTEFERVRLRQFQKQLDSIGLTTQVIALSAKRLLRVRQALEKMTIDFWKNYVLCHDAGFIFIDNRDFNSLSEEVALRVLAKAFSYVSGSEARMSQLEKLYTDLSNNLCVTLCECVIVKNKRGIYVCREFAKMPVPKNLKKDEVSEWAGFKVLCNQDVTVAPLNNNLKIEGFPAIVKKVIPAFFDKKGLAFVPSLDYKRKKTDISGIIEKRNEK